MVNYIRKIIYDNMNRITISYLLLTMCWFCIDSTSLSRVQINSKNIIYQSCRIPLKQSLILWACTSAWIPENYFVFGSSLMRSSLWISIYNDIDRHGLLLGSEHIGRWTMSAIYIGSPLYTTYLPDEEFIDLEMCIFMLFIQNISKYRTSNVY